MDKRNKTKLNYFYKTLLTLLIVSLYLLLYIGSNGDGTSTAESGTGKELISAPKDGISFKVSSENNNYGFDAIKDKEDAYISLEAEIDKSTNFNVIVKDNPNGAMASPWSYILNIVGSDYNGNYFLNNNETTELTITSLEGNEARTMIEIYGCTGELDGYDDCNIYENQLNVELYKKKVIKQLNVILLNGAVFPSSADELRNYMNSILKQAVYKIDYVLFSEWTLSDFDANKNGHLDLWATQPVPDDDELDDITDIGFGRGWWSYDEPGIAVLNENIKTHWGVEYETSAGDNEINLEDVAAYIEEETYLTIGPLPGNDGTAEKFYVNYKSDN